MTRKPNPTLVNPHLVRMALADPAVTERGHVYGACVRLSYRTTGQLAPGFDNADLQAWLLCNGYADPIGKDRKLRRGVIGKGE